MVVWSPDGAKLASSSNDGTVRIWDGKTYKCLHVLESTHARGASLLFSHNGLYLASGSTGYTCRVWMVDTGVLHKELRGHRDSPGGVVATLDPRVDHITKVAFDPEDSRIAAASRDGRVWIWNVKTAEELMVLHEHHKLVSTLSFSPGDGKHILSGSRDSTLKICDSFTGERVATLEGHLNTINSAMFSLDGRFVVSASSDGTVRLWRRSDGENVKRFVEHNDKVTHVVFSPNGKRLSSGSVNGSVFIRAP